MPRPRVLSVPERLDAHPEFEGRGVTIAFVDAGFFAHPDLMRPEKRIRAFVDVTRDVPQGSEFFTPHPRAWHGTMTSCAAAGNGYMSGGRYRGLASASEVVLIKASTDAGEILGKNVAAAMRYVLNHKELGVRIVNVSMGVEPDDPHVKDVEKAVRDLVAAGITVFAAAGNSPGNPPEPPGCCLESITVGGGNDGNTSDTDDDQPWPSSHGMVHPGVHKPDLLAPAFWLPASMLPGTLVAREAAALFQVLSVLEEITAEQTYRAEAGAQVDCDDRDDALAFTAAIEARIERGKYIAPETQHVDGTSFASPIVAAIAAQMLEADPSLTPALLREGLLGTAVPIPKIDRAQQGAGVVRARAAVEWARARAAGKR
ncbi:MAG: alkaline serine protease [Myxococcaceae bacterium]|jgi:serine protease AprX|nr:alkaline serine protease [Myxococcaceae bacterium]